MWYMNDERELLKESAREFAENEVRPLVESMEFEDKYPDELVKRMGELGFTGLPYPEALGGSGATWTDYAIAMEEISRVSNNAGLIMLLNTAMTAMPLVMMANDRQKEEILKPCLAGDLNLAIAITEPAGIFNIPEFATIAKRDGDEWVINGQKMFTSSAGHVDYYILVTATAGIEGAPDGLTYFIVPADTSGIEVGAPEHKLGWHGSSSCQTFYTDVRLSDEWRLGEVGGGFPENTLGWAAFECLGFGPMCLGGAEAAYETALEYTRNRMYNGTSCFDTYQAVRMELAQMYLDIEALRGMVYTVCAKVDAGEQPLRDMYGLKVKGAEIQERVCSKAITLMGGLGLVVESDVERQFRDAKVNAIGGASVMTLTDVVGGML